MKRHRRIRRATKTVNDLIEADSAIKLEIGAGPVKGRNGWTTLDLNEESDLFWDLRELLPFPDGSVDILYCSHVLEHFH